MEKYVQESNMGSFSIENLDQKSEAFCVQNSLFRAPCSGIVQLMDQLIEPVVATDEGAVNEEMAKKNVKVKNNQLTTDEEQSSTQIHLQYEKSSPVAIRILNTTIDHCYTRCTLPAIISTNKASEEVVEDVDTNDQFLSKNYARSSKRRNVDQNVLQNKRIRLDNAVFSDLMTPPAIGEKMGCDHAFGENDNKFNKAGHSDKQNKENLHYVLKSPSPRLDQKSLLKTPIRRSTRKNRINHNALQESSPPTLEFYPKNSFVKSPSTTPLLAMESHPISDDSDTCVHYSSLKLSSNLKSVSINNTIRESPPVFGNQITPKKCNIRHFKKQK